MGLFDFVMDAGAKLLGGGDESVAATPATSIPRDPAPAPVSAGSLHLHLNKLGLAPDDLAVGFADGVATLTGTAASQEMREKAILAAGNVAGVAQVDDQMTIAGAAPKAVFYTVQGGDTLSGISKAHYGKSMKYMVIFEANKPMLDNPDRIYPGQVLRIPPLD